MGRGFGRTAGVIAMWISLAAAAFAQAPQPGARFDITAYVVDGSPLLKSEEFSRIIAPFVGTQKSAADVQKAQQTLQQAYFDLGYCSVQVTVRKPAPDAGVITFRLLHAPGPLSKDCLPTVVLEETRTAQPVVVGPGEVAVRPFADVSGALSETAPPATGGSELARAPVKPLQDGPKLKPLQDRPAVLTPTPGPVIVATPVPLEETASNVTVKPLSQTPAPQPGLVASTEISIPSQADKPSAASVVRVAPPTAGAGSPMAPQIQLKPSIALAAVAQPTPKIETPPLAVSAAPQIAPAPNVEATLPTPIVSAPEKSAVVAPAPVAATVISAPKVEVPSVVVAITPPVAVVEQKPAETPAVPAIAAPVRPAEPIVVPEPAVPTAAIAVAPPVVPVPEVEAASAPPPVISERAKTAAVKPEPAPEKLAMVVPPIVAASSLAPKAEVPPVEVAIAPPAALSEILPPAIQAAPPESAPAVEMPKIVAVEEKSVLPIEPKSAVEPIKVKPSTAPEVKVLQAEKTIEKPAPPAVVSAPKGEPESLVVESLAKSAPVAERPKGSVAEEKPVVRAAPKTAIAAEPTKEQIAAQADSRPTSQSAPPVPAIAGETKPELSVAVAAAPAIVPKVEAKPTEKPETVSTLAAPSEVTVRPFADAAAIPEEAPAETEPEITRVPVRPLQDRPQAPAPPAEKPAIATAPAAAAPKPETTSAVKSATTKPESASTPRVAEATSNRDASADKKPAPKAAPVFVRAPAESLKLATPENSKQSTDGSPAVAAPLKFAIERFRVLGNTVLKPETITRVLVGYTGPQKDFGDVQRALEALQTAFQDAGYGAVQVTLPEQELDDGEVDLDVIETRLGKIDVQGNDYHNEQNVRNSLPEVTEGRTPNSLAIARNLRVANENSSKQTQVALRAGSQDGEVDATIKIVDDSPIKRSVTLDNTGTYASGKYRIGFGYQHANMFNRDHLLTLQYITSPEHPSAVTVLGFGYHVPLYKLGHSIDLIAGYSDVQSGTVQQLFNVSGAGTIFGARYNQNLDRSENYEHKITYGIDYRAFKNNVTFTGSTQPLVPDITVHPVSITYSGLRRAADSQLDFYASYAQNIFPGGNDGANSDFQGPTEGFANGSRAGAKAGYNIIRAGANYTRQIWGEWQARAVFAVQQTDSALIAGEQFGVGGADSVRGFDERAFSNDRGYRGSFELYTPDMASNFSWTGGRIKFLVFYDTANVTRNFRQPGEQDGLSLDSYGLGLRLQTKNYVSLRADYAQVRHDGGLTAGMLNGRQNSNTLHASMVLVF